MRNRNETHDFTGTWGPEGSERFIHLRVWWGPNHKVRFSDGSIKLPTGNIGPLRRIVGENMKLDIIDYEDAEVVAHGFTKPSTSFDGEVSGHIKWGDNIYPFSTKSTRIVSPEEVPRLNPAPPSTIRPPGPAPRTIDVDRARGQFVFWKGPPEPEPEPQGAPQHSDDEEDEGPSSIPGILVVSAGALGLAALTWKLVRR